MNQAINAYYSITASPEFRELERLRERAGHDEAQALHHAKQEGRKEGRTEGAEMNLLANLKALMKKLGFSAEEAMDTLGVPFETRARLRVQL